MDVSPAGDSAATASAPRTPQEMLLVTDARAERGESVSAALGTGWDAIALPSGDASVRGQSASGLNRGFAGNCR